MRLKDLPRVPLPRQTGGAHKLKNTVRVHVCRYCRAFFRNFRCNAPDECDCPRCQGLCECE